MSAETILIIIITITVVSYLFDQYLDLLNYRHYRRDVPIEVASFYDQEKYEKSLAYHRALARFGFVTSALSIVTYVIVLSTGTFGNIDAWLRSYLSGSISLALAFFAVVMLASDILTLPFQLYATFVIEERFGFNKTTVKTFVIDKIKGYVLGSLIGAPLLALMIYLITIIGQNFWIWFGIATAMVILLMNMFYTSLILPWFNKLTPLPEGDLKTVIERFATKVSFPLDSIFIIDGSKRSKKANAFFSGIGKKKKIVLYDTLIENHSTEELVAVLAHEVGHYKKKHITLGYILSVIQIFFMLFVLSTMVFNQNLSLALGGTTQAIHLNLLAFGILFSPLSGFIGLFMNMYSRKNEFEADNYARQTFDGHALANALKKLSVDSLSNLYPHPWYVFFHYSHPPLLQRLRALSRG
jgi:STE24 endopeptidase